jgi:mRNA interferase MazF
MSALVARCEVYWVDLDPVRGSELAKTRPCVVVSETEVNRVRRTVVVVPLTSTDSPTTWPLLIGLPDFTPKTKARIEQIRAVDRSRLRKRIAVMDAKSMLSIEAALSLVLHIGSA